MLITVDTSQRSDWLVLDSTEYEAAETDTPVTIDNAIHTVAAHDNQPVAPPKPNHHVRSKEAKVKPVKDGEKQHGQPKNPTKQRGAREKDNRKKLNIPGPTYRFGNTRRAHDKQGYWLTPSQHSEFKDCFEGPPRNYSEEEWEDRWYDYYYSRGNEAPTTASSDSGTRPTRYPNLPPPTYDNDHSAANLTYHGRRRGRYNEENYRERHYDPREQDQARHILNFDDRPPRSDPPRVYYDERELVENNTLVKLKGPAWYPAVDDWLYSNVDPYNQQNELTPDLTWEAAKHQDHRCQHASHGTNDLDNPGQTYREITRIRSPLNRRNDRHRLTEREIQSRIEELTAQIDELNSELRYLRRLTPANHKYNFQYTNVKPTEW